MQTVSQTDQHDDSFDYDILHSRLRTVGKTLNGPLFTTDAMDLFDTFLLALPESRRHHYICRACRRFVDTFGGVVTINRAGVITSPIWDDSPGVPFFTNAIESVRARVERARVTGVFLSSEQTWGIPSTPSAKAPGGTWFHMHTVPTPEVLHRETPTRNAHQAMAERHEEYGMLSRGLAEFPIELVRKAHTLLTSGGLYRSEKCIGVAKWLLDLHEAREAESNRYRRENLTWSAVASAPPGFCHVRSTMIGTLLEDIAADKPFADIKRSFDAKMSPIIYQRPQAAPSSGQIAAAETTIAKLASAGALARRYARLEEVLPHAIWTPKAEAKATSAGGVFGHLKAAQTPAPIEVPPQVVTWEKFARTVLSTAEQLEFLIPHGHSSYFAFVTAADPAAPPILQWDSEESRNPVSWYLRQSGSTAEVWNLGKPGSFVSVDAVMMQPSSWNRTNEHQGNGAYFILRGANDRLAGGAGIALFPEILKSEYHGIRAVLEAHSRSQTLGGANDASACGICVQKNSQNANLTFRSTQAGARISYRIDRWD